jgi:RNA polymerase sigma-70 factor (ECF subfamily)
MRASEFKTLVMPYCDRIYRLAFRLMGNREESEDIVQEVYLKLWGLRSQLDQYDSIEALSIRIARNLCLDNLRRRKTNQNAMNSERTKWEDSHSETPVDSLEKKEEKQLVLSLIEALPEPQRSLVHLRHIEEKDYEEIASMVNMNVNAIRVSISRARKQMREMLEKNYATWKA